MDISGTHSYQQISVYAIFQKEIFNLIKTGEIIYFLSKCFNFLL